MDLPLSQLFVVHWIRPLESVKKANAFKEKAKLRKNNHFLFHIEDSIHYDALTSGNFETYHELITTTDQKEHSKEKFQKLMSEWDWSSFRPIEIEWHKHLAVYCVRDGVHRLAVLKARGFIENFIPSALFRVTYLAKDISSIEKALRDTTLTCHSNGWNNRTTYGYHSIQIGNLQFVGQRTPAKRVQDLRKWVSFEKKTAIDFGCNVGGMLLHLWELSSGVGVDFDAQCIVAGNLIKTVIHQDKFTFLQKDLETCDFDSCMPSTCHESKVDLVFLGSLGSWVRNWQRLYTWAVSHTREVILFEENNSHEGKVQLDFFESLGCRITLIINGSDDDTTGNRMRNTYLVFPPARE